MSDWAYQGYESAEISAREVIGMLRRRWFTVLVMLVLSIALAAFLTARMTPVYRSRATMVIEQSPQRMGITAEEGPSVGLTASAIPHSIETQVEVLESGPLKAKVGERLGQIAGDAFPSLTAGQVSTTDIIEVVGESTDPQVARDATNFLVEEYIEESKQKKSATIRQARTFVEEKREEAQEQLARAEAGLRDFKEKNHLPDLSSNRNNAITQANSVREELRTKSNELLRLRGQIQEVRTRLVGQRNLIRGGYTEVPNPKRDRLEAEIDKLKQQRITLLRTLKPTEPEVEEVDKQIARLQGDMTAQPPITKSGESWQPNPARAALETRLTELGTLTRGLEREVARLSEQNAEAYGRLGSFPAWEARLAQLQQERDQAQEDCKALTVKLRDLRIKEQSIGETAHPLTRAKLPKMPIRPQPMLNFLVAGALGLVFGIGVACLREMVDDRVHTAEDGERVLGLPILGRIPSFPRRTPALIPIRGESPAKESYRRLRAGVTFVTSTDPVQSLMVTSATAGEGKSTTAANLALAVALQGRRVILVDADMREPSLSRVMRAAPGPGLGDVLSGAVPLASALQSTDVENLLLLTAGTAGPNSAELLSCPRMEEVVRQLSELADLVILDTPPCLPVADAEVLGSWVDGALLVVGVGRTNRDSVRAARELLEQAHIRVLGAVLNRVKQGEYGYYRYRALEGLAADHPQVTESALAPRTADALNAPAMVREEKLG